MSLRRLLMICQPTAVHGARGGGPLGSLRAFAWRWLYFPDGQVGWYPGAEGAAAPLQRLLAWKPGPESPIVQFHGRGLLDELC